VGLSGEKISWTKKLADYKESAKNITGDIVMTSVIIAYLGPFVKSYRDDCITAWKHLLKEQ
jgi:dynein heavy chain